jgi:acyl CoA:acetate/3-ketoacid CoA transferase beta subunit
VFDVNSENGLELLEIAEGVGMEDVKASTGCSFKVRIRKFAILSHLIILGIIKSYSNETN